MAGDPVTMDLTTCSAGDLTFAIGRLEVSDSTRVELFKQVLREALQVNLAVPARPAALDVEAAPTGDKPWIVEGTGPDGEPMQAQSRIFNKGTTVFQATVIGRRLAPEVVDFFFSSIRAPP